jgi:hypothetical protein
VAALIFIAFYGKVSVPPHSATCSARRFLKHNAPQSDKALMNTTIATVISVCCRKDIKTWELVSHAITRYINAESFKVIVPKNEVAAFRNITCKEIEVVSENEELKDIDIYATAAKLGSKKRAGWYYQQLLKIHSLSQTSHDAINVIWDADTLPLKPLNFIAEDGRLIFYTSDEHHQPYFDHIKHTLHLNKIITTSFIAQCFPAKTAWVKSYLTALEQYNNCSWIDAILLHINKEEPYGFSEYESMGTYFTHNFMQQMIFSNAKWERFGNSKLGIKNLSPEAAQNLSKTIDYISFENWDVADRMPELGPNKTVAGFFGAYFSNTSTKTVIQVGTANPSIPEDIQRQLNDETVCNLKYILIEPSKDICATLHDHAFYKKHIAVITARCGNNAAKSVNTSERAISIADISYAKDNKNLVIIITDTNDILSVLHGMNWRFPPKHIFINTALLYADTAQNFLFAKGYKYICGTDYKFYLLAK